MRYREVAKLEIHFRVKVMVTPIGHEELRVTPCDFSHKRNPRRTCGFDSRFHQGTNELFQLGNLRTILDQEVTRPYRGKGRGYASVFLHLQLFKIISKGLEFSSLEFIISFINILKLIPKILCRITMHNINKY